MTIKKTSANDIETLMQIRLDATQAGRPLYEKLGFCENNAGTERTCVPQGNYL